jgi:hypothetical protein
MITNKHGRIVKRVVLGGRQGHGFYPLLQQQLQSLSTELPSASMERGEEAGGRLPVFWVSVEGWP